MARRLPFAVLALLTILLVAPPAVSAAGLAEWRAQLSLAKAVSDTDSVIELARRIIAADAHDASAWTALVESQIKSEDYDRALAALDAWERVAKPRPAAIDSYRGDIFLAREDPADAEKAWRASLGIKPNDYVVLSKLADLLETEERWPEVLDLRTRAAAEPTAALLAARAGALMHLHQWDAAIGDIHKANKLDATDETVLKWLPKLELLASKRAEIFASDSLIDLTKIAEPKNPRPLLDQAALFTEIGQPSLALSNAKRALEMAPDSIRARIQAGEADLDLGKPLDAAKLKVSHDLKLGKDGALSAETLHDLDRRDADVQKNPGKPVLLAARSKSLRDINQYVLALDDAQAALALDANSPDAEFEMGHDLDGLGRAGEALPHIVRATELRPGDPVAWYYRGVVEANRADFNAAVASETRSLAIHESAAALKARLDAELRLGLAAQAAADSQRLHVIDPADSQ